MIMRVETFLILALSMMACVAQTQAPSEDKAIQTSPTTEWISLSGFEVREFPGYSSGSRAPLDGDTVGLAIYVFDEDYREVHVVNAPMIRGTEGDRQFTGASFDTELLIPFRGRRIKLRLGPDRSRPYRVMNHETGTMEDTTLSIPLPLLDDSEHFIETVPSSSSQVVLDRNNLISVRFTIGRGQAPETEAMLCAAYNATDHCEPVECDEHRHCPAHQYCTGIGTCVDHCHASEGPEPTGPRPSCEGYSPSFWESDWSGDGSEYVASIRTATGAWSQCMDVCNAEAERAREQAQEQAPEPPKHTCTGILGTYQHQECAYDGSQCCDGSWDTNCGPCL